MLSDAMPHRRLGGLSVSIVGLGCNNFGRRRSTPTGRAPWSTPRSTPESPSSTPPTATAARAAARRSSARCSRAAATGGARDQVRMDMGDGPRRAARLARVHPPGGRGLAAPPADRRDRPLPVPPARRRHPDRRDPRSARRARRSGHGALHRRSNVTAAADRGGGRGGARPGFAGSRRTPEQVQPAEPRGGARGAADVRAARDRCCPSSRSPAACSPASTAAASDARSAAAARRARAGGRPTSFARLKALAGYAAERGLAMTDVAIGALTRAAGGLVGDRRGDTPRTGARERPRRALDAGARGSGRAGRDLPPGAPGARPGRRCLSSAVAGERGVTSPSASSHRRRHRPRAAGRAPTRRPSPPRSAPRRPSTSSGGPSNSSSSWICRISRERSPAIARWQRTIATLMMSAAVPWITMLTARRSPSACCWRLRARSSGIWRRRPEQRRDVALLDRLRDRRAR